MSENRSRNWLKISCIGCVGAPCLILLVTFGWVKVQINKIGNRLPEGLAKLRAMNVPTEPVDLVPNPPIPEDQNAASEYQSLISEMKRLRADKSNKEFFEAISNYGTIRTQRGDEALIVSKLKKLEAFVQRLDNLSKYPHLYFPRDYSKGALVMFPEYAEIKQFAKWQAARARLLIKAGDWRGSQRALASIFAMSNHCLEEPTLIGALVGIAINSIGYVALEAHLEAFKSNVAALASTRKLLESMTGKFDMRRSLQGEVVMGRIAIQDMRSWNEFSFSEHGFEEGGSRENPIDRLTLHDPSVRKMFESKYVEVWFKAYEKMPADGTDWRGVQQAMVSIEEKLEKDQSLENKLNQIMFPVLSQFGVASGTYQAKHRLALLATLLLQERPNGLPKDLSKYGELAIDPMDGKPIRYKVKGGGFKIWSIGRDLKDNGGLKFYPGTGMSSQNVDDVLHFFYPEKPPKKLTTVPITAGGPPALPASPAPPSRIE